MCLTACLLPPQFLVGGAEPLSLEGFLAQERRLADATEAQHIHNKMLYDAVNEALLAIYKAANRVQVRTASWLMVLVSEQWCRHGLDVLRGCTAHASDLPRAWCMPVGGCTGDTVHRKSRKYS